MLRKISVHLRKIIVMTLRDVEKFLQIRRMELYGNNLNMFRLTTQKSMILRIEGGHVYAIKSLFSYLKDLGLKLLVNGETITTSTELGYKLKKTRKRKYIKQIDCPVIMGLNRTRVYKIEKGYGNRTSLEKYLNALNISLILMEELPPSK